MVLRRMQPFDVLSIPHVAQRLLGLCVEVPNSYFSLSALSG